jgi:hypothetical protein
MVVKKFLQIKKPLIRAYYSAFTARLAMKSLIEEA